MAKTRWKWKHGKARRWKDGRAKTYGPSRKFKGKHGSHRDRNKDRAWMQRGEYDNLPRRRKWVMWMWW